MDEFLDVLLSKNPTFEQKYHLIYWGKISDYRRIELIDSFLDIASPLAFLNFLSSSYVDISFKMASKVKDKLERTEFDIADILKCLCNHNFPEQLKTPEFFSHDKLKAMLKGRSANFYCNCLCDPIFPDHLKTAEIFIMMAEWLTLDDIYRCVSDGKFPQKLKTMDCLLPVFEAKNHSKENLTYLAHYIISDFLKRDDIPKVVRSGMLKLLVTTEGNINYHFIFSLFHDKEILDGFKFQFVHWLIDYKKGEENDCLFVDILIDSGIDVKFKSEQLVRRVLESTNQHVFNEILVSKLILEPDKLGFLPKYLSVAELNQKVWAVKDKDIIPEIREKIFLNILLLKDKEQSLMVDDMTTIFCSSDVPPRFKLNGLFLLEFLKKMPDATNLMVVLLDENVPKESKEFLKSRITKK